MGKKRGGWTKWRAAIAILAFIAVVCLRVVFNQMGASVYPYVDL